MSDSFKLDDYIDVAERLVDFHGRYPEGSLQTIDWQVADVAGKTFIVYRAAAFRTPDDPRPGHGAAWEPFPGATSFTKNSELMNAETAAWGRAILACGLPAKRGLASLQEVRNRVAEQENDSKPPSHGKPRGKGKTPPPSSDGHSGAEDGSQGTSGGDALVTTEQLENIARLYRDAHCTPADMRAIFKEAGAEGKKTDQLTEDEATWVIVRLTAKAKETA